MSVDSNPNYTLNYEEPDNRDRFVRVKEDATKDLSACHQTSAIFAYVSHNLTGISDDIHFITEAQDPDQLRSAFRQIFE